MGEPQPGVRRLCIAAVTRPAGLLTAACRLQDPDRLYLSINAQDCIETAFAPPGIHEVAVVKWLTAAVEELCSVSSGAGGPAMIAFHVGITKIEGDGFAGAAPLRVRALLRDPTIQDAVRGCLRLAVIMSDGLYADLQAEGLAGREWLRVPEARAWVRCCLSPRPLFQ